MKISPHSLIWNGISLISAVLVVWFSLSWFFPDFIMVLLLICIVMIVSRLADGYEARDVFDPGGRTECFFAGLFIAAAIFTFYFKSGWLHGSSLLSMVVLFLYPVFLWRRILRFLDQRIYPDYDNPRINSDADKGLVRFRKIIFWVGPPLYTGVLILIYFLKR